MGHLVRLSEDLREKREAGSFASQLKEDLRKGPMDSYETGPMGARAQISKRAMDLHLQSGNAIGEGR